MKAQRIKYRPLTGAAENLEAAGRDDGERPHADRANMARRIVSLAAFLLPPDRALIEAVYGDGMEVARLAEVVGISARLVRARLNRLVRRMCMPEFAYVVSQLDRMEGVHGAVARACILEGRSVRAVAKALGVTTHQVCMNRTMVLIQARTLMNHEPEMRGTPDGRWKSSYRVRGGGTRQ